MIVIRKNLYPCWAMTHLLKFAGTPPAFTAGLPSRSAFPFWPTEAHLPPTSSLSHRRVGPTSQPAPLYLFFFLG
jgi:hypothetical protein